MPQRSTSNSHLSSWLSLLGKNPKKTRFPRPSGAPPGFAPRLLGPLRAQLLLDLPTELLMLLLQRLTRILASKIQRPPEVAGRCAASPSDHTPSHLASSFRVVTQEQSLGRLHKSGAPNLARAIYVETS